jgi:membrane associated rhomboid family serine protease
VSTGGPDLFVVCKNCGSEVSPYITECPYCGNRLRKRAPKIDREGRVTEKRRARRPTPTLPRLKRGEIPGIRADSRPYATILLVVLGLVGCLLWRTGLIGLTSLAVFGKLGPHEWRLATASFAYNNTGYAFVTLGTVGLYGWLIEHRHGHISVILLYLLGAVGGLAVASLVYGDNVASLGANGGALALLCAWAVPDLLELRAGEEVEGDLIGTAVIAAVVALMPLAAPGASWIAGGVGAVVGFAAGLLLTRTSSR